MLDRSFWHEILEGYESKTQICVVRSRTESKGWLRRKAFVRSFIFDNSVEHLYSRQLHVTETKKKDLLSLCVAGAIPSEFHAFYENLPSSVGRDALPCPNGSDSDCDSEWKVINN